MNWFVKIARMLGKDLSLFYRDKRTFILVFIAPLIIMLILSNIFDVQDTSQAIKGVTIGVCNLDTEELPLETDVFNVMLLEGDCMTQAQDLVREGTLRVAVVVPQGFSEDIRQGRGSTLLTYVDNAKGQIAIVSSAALKGFVSDLNEQIGTQFIEAAWVRLNELNDQLAFAEEQLSIADEYARDVRSRLNEIRGALDDVNLVELRETFVDFNESLSTINEALGNASELLGSDLTNMTNVTVGLNTTVPIPSAQLNTSELKGFYNLECAIANASNPVCPLLKSTVAKIDEVNQQSALLTEYLSNATNQNIVLTDALSQLNGVLDTVHSSVDSSSELLEQHQENLSFIFSAFDSMLASEENFRAEVNRVDALIVNYTEMVSDLHEEIARTRREISEFTTRDPRSILRAVTLEESKAFPDRSILEFMIPGILVLILMFVTMFISSSMIVNEKRSGCMARNFLAPISIFTFMCEKALYLLILSAIEIVCMMVVIFAKGISVPLSLPLITALALTSFAFVSIGMLIGSLSQTENTALLSSLVLGLPMLFLSGLFFPFEIMPPIMRTIGGYLPLTLSVDILNQILIYGHGLVRNDALLLAGLSLVIFLLATYRIKKKPMA